MDDNKVYTPEVIQETPFPGDIAVISSEASQSGTGGNYTPATNKEVKLPQKRIATDLLSTALNTRSRKVLQEFQLEQSGGFQVGDFKQGQSGDIKITPNGITARNIAGVTTFVIDGDSGDAVFAGEIKSGSTVTGSVEVTDGYIALYNNGILEIFIGDDGS